MDESPPTPGSDELPHLGTFARVAERGSFTAAALDLGITQAAVSQRIALLERGLRVSLFDRRAGRIALTEAGHRLYDYARRILDLHEQARRDLGGHRPPISGDLPIAASSVPGECYLPALLSSFRQAYPRVHVRASAGDSGSVVRDVVAGRATLGLVGKEAGTPALESRPIGTDLLVLIVPPGHAWASREAISLKALAIEPLVIREPGSGSRRALEAGLERAGASLAGMNVALELGSNSAIRDAVRRRLGVAFLSRSAVQPDLDSGALRAVGVRGLDLARHLYVIHHGRRPLSPAASVFLHFLKAHPLDPDRR
ncbi:LysR family transcriptional regulator [Tautonia plasticadhaerens]|uniref:HTH-type transcriptional activator CmpR n=1 Tax=Tautonia plasticadhaerens TaxID=2527974 RepID=A0A518H9Y8_9BACT|nr:LysR family transcriptional regulator [Tautonia plasticadhaerens]QDV37556.1 HTH-type transcriptional activator CmpR [Tautonia plasticadhaerens]